MPVFKKYEEEAKKFFKISFLICSTSVKVSQKFPLYPCIMSKEIDVQWS